MSRRYDLERCVGVMVWAMTTHHKNIGRCMTVEEARAKAHFRQPELEELEMDYVQNWALAAIRAGDMLKVAPAHMTLQDILDAAGVPRAT